MRSSFLPPWLAATAFLVVSLAASNADAYCRTSTLGLEDGCTISEGSCCTLGKPLYWKNACVGYSIHKVASRSIPYDDTADAIATAFRKWTDVTCQTDGQGSSRVSVDVRDLGKVDCGVVAYDKQGGPNQHVIAYRDDIWGHADASNTLALTTVVYNPDTGEIYDADMEINTAEHTMTTKDPIPDGGYDFASIVTHEVGHFLGMAHATDVNATMFAQYNPGSTQMRNLTLDDVNGICAAYPPDGTRLTADDVKIPEDVCDPTPRGGFTTQCPPPPSSRCSIGPGGVGQNASGSSGWREGALVFVGLTAAIARRRKR